MYMYQKEFVPTCTILGKSIVQLPGGTDENYPVYVHLKQSLTEKIRSIYDSGVHDFLCNCEYGVPMWAAEIVLALRTECPDIRLHVAVPYEDQAALWNETARERYYAIHEAANTVEILMGSLQTDVETAYRLAEREMLRRSTVVLAVREPQRTAENMGMTVLSLEKI